MGVENATTTLSTDLIAAREIGGNAYGCTERPSASIADLVSIGIPNFPSAQQQQKNILNARRNLSEDYGIRFVLE